MTAAQGFVFGLGSIGVLLISRRALRRPDFHGFYRFFAFEAILALFALNYPYWFINPFVPTQMAAWLLLLVSAILAAQGFNLLKSSGKPDKPRETLPTLGIENTSALVTKGIYGYIRHPLYASLLALTWGIALKHLGWDSLVLSGISTFFLYLTAKVEERENLLFFGSCYRYYMQGTKMFVPFLF